MLTEAEKTDTIRSAQDCAMEALNNALDDVPLSTAEREQICLAFAWRLSEQRLWFEQREVRQ